MFHPSTSSSGQRWSPAPITDPLTTGSVLGVWLSPDEEVDWHVCFGPDGTQLVNGYTIKKKRGHLSNNIFGSEQNIFKLEEKD